MIRDLLDVAGAVPSWLLFLQLRAVMRRVAVKRVRAGRIPPDWQLLDDALLEDDTTLLFVVVTAPRWNPHAAVAVSGPVSVRGEVRFDDASLRSRHWTVVANRFPDMRQVAWAGSSRDQGEVCMRLPAGTYRFAARLYEPEADASFPGLTVDGAEQVPEARVGSDPTAFYAGLPRRARPLFRRIHRHVPTLLRLEGRLPTGLARRYYLPVGNPETAFRYGFIDRGQSLDLTLGVGFPEDASAYACIYDAASFPVLYQRLQPGSQTLGPAPERGSWLLRLVPGPSGAAVPEDPPGVSAALRPARG